MGAKDQIGQAYEPESRDNAVEAHQMGAKDQLERADESDDDDVEAHQMGQQRDA
jgi:hypothetical protein